MKQSIQHTCLLALLVTLLCSSMTSCRDRNQPDKADFTLLFLQPYSSLNEHTENDLRETDACISRNQGNLGATVLYVRHRNDGRVSREHYQLCKKVFSDGRVTDEVVREYLFSETDYTTFSGLSTILHDAIKASKTKHYGMIISSHGNGWYPAIDGSKISHVAASPQTNATLKKYYGGGDGKTYDADFATLAKAVEQTGKRWDVLLIDACNCQNIEVLYDLQKAFHYVIASTAEIASIGQDYTTELLPLVKGDYQAVCDAFKRSTEHLMYWNCALLSVANCDAVMEVMHIMQLIHAGPQQPYDRAALQVFDGEDFLRGGYNVFYDMSDYVHHVCADRQLLDTYDQAMAKLIPYQVYTSKYNSSYFPTDYMRDVRTSCGVTCSEPCIELRSKWEKTAWAKSIGF